MRRDTKIFLGFGVALAVIVIVLSVLTHRKGTDVKAGDANCTIDSTNVVKQADGRFLVPKGTIIECDGPVDASTHFTLKKTD